MARLNNSEFTLHFDVGTSKHSLYIDNIMYTHSLSLSLCAAMFKYYSHLHAILSITATKNLNTFYTRGRYMLQ